MPNRQHITISDSDRTGRSERRKLDIKRLPPGGLRQFACGWLRGQDGIGACAFINLIHHLDNILHLETPTQLTLCQSFSLRQISQGHREINIDRLG